MGNAIGCCVAWGSPQARAMPQYLLSGGTVFLEVVELTRAECDRYGLRADARPSPLILARLRDAPLTRPPMLFANAYAAEVRWDDEGGGATRLATRGAPEPRADRPHLVVDSLETHARWCLPATEQEATAAKPAAGPAEELVRVHNAVLSAVADRFVAWADAAGMRTVPAPGKAPPPAGEGPRPPASARGASTARTGQSRAVLLGAFNRQETEYFDAAARRFRERSMLPTAHVAPVSGLSPVEGRDVYLDSLHGWVRREDIEDGAAGHGVELQALAPRAVGSEAGRQER
jgi:hypothetical protein